MTDTSNDTEMVPNTSTDTEFMSNSELIQELSKVAQHYGTLNDMCKKSLELKKENQTDLYLVLDAAIALQIYAHISKKSEDQEKKDVALDLIKTTFTKLSEA